MLRCKLKPRADTTNKLHVSNQLFSIVETTGCCLIKEVEKQVLFHVECAKCGQTVVVLHILQPFITSFM